MKKHSIMSKTHLQDILDELLEFQSMLEDNPNIYNESYLISEIRLIEDILEECKKITKKYY